MDLYFGLILIIPFINKGYNALEKKEQIYLIAILYVISSVSKWILTKSSMILGGSFVLVSSHFYDLSFVLYYLLGSYISQHKPQFPKKLLSFFCISVFMLHAFYEFNIGYGKYYQDIPGVLNFWYDHPILIIEATLVFLLLYDIKIESTCFKSIFRRIAIVSFDMYLVSYIWDVYAYKNFFDLYFQAPYVVVFLFCICMSFVLSYLSSVLKHKMFFILRKILVTIR